MKIVVITAITADRDTLKENQNTEGADFVAFCDRPLSSQTWDVRPACDLFRDPVRNAKIHKVLPHLYFPDHDYSLWIDGTLELIEPVPTLIEQHLRGIDVVFARHGVHRTLGDEIEACLREVLDDPALIREQIASTDTARSSLGCPLLGVILRRHVPSVAMFNALWWSVICRWSRRDQLSVLQCATATGLQWGYFPRLPELEEDPRHRLLGSPHFRWYPHGQGVVVDDASSLAPDAQLDTPTWWRRRLAFVEAVSGSREAYALSLESELSKHRRWALELERYAHSLESELRKYRPSGGHLEESSDPPGSSAS